ncbi:hypothetical protein FHX57_007780, partial [Paraburkholderia tropica]|uniref:hypothetical protein n=1 Tax=Paraburkholderia tropica TaxID=92647 RepID=UPI001620B7F7
DDSGEAMAVIKRFRLLHRFILLPHLQQPDSASVGSFITLYGVVFALIELAYTRSAAELAATAAKRVFDAMSRLGAVEQITDCQAYIKTAVACIDDGVAVPSAVMLDIVKIYSRVFQVQLEDASSEHRKNRSLLEAYRFDSARYDSFNAQGKTAITSSSGSARRSPPHPYAKTRQALIAMAGQLSSHQSKHTTFAEIRQ